MSTMFCGGDAINLASLPMTKSSTIRIIIIICICASTDIAQTKLTDKQHNLSKSTKETSNSHDNQILRSTSSSNQYLQPPTLESAHLNRNEHDITRQLAANTVKTPIEIAQTHHRNINGRHRRSVVPLAEALVTGTKVTQEGRTTGSIFVPSTPSISLLPSSANMSSNISQPTATVSYNGLIGVNATDPFAITTESRYFGLPTEIQVSWLLMGTNKLNQAVSSVPLAAF